MTQTITRIKKTFLDHLFPTLFWCLFLIGQHRSHKEEKCRQDKSIRIVIRQETKTHSNGRHCTSCPVPSFLIRLDPGIKK